MAVEWREFHPPHVYEDDACYFLTASTLGRQRLLGPSRRTTFRNILREMTSRYRVKLYAWVILANHYHLLLHIPAGSSLSAFIKVLHSQSAGLLNRLDGTPGRKVWCQYWDRFPRDERDFWSYFNYIHINPLKHGYVQAAPADMVGDGEWARPDAAHLPDVHGRLLTYPHSSYAQHVRERGVEWMMDVWLRYPIRASLVDWDD